MIDASPSCHGVMLEVHGQGVLLQGESGVGKSDLALGLVARGHRLVADDMVDLRRRGERLEGSCRQGFAGFLEVTGLGLVNLQRLYGERAVCEVAELTLVLQLASHPHPDYDGLQPVAFDWRRLGVTVPAWHLRWSHQRDMPLIVETALHLNQLRRQGYDAGSDLQSNLASLLAKGVA